MSRMAAMAPTYHTWPQWHPKMGVNAYVHAVVAHTRGDATAIVPAPLLASKCYAWFVFAEKNFLHTPEHSKNLVHIVPSLVAWHLPRLHLRLESSGAKPADVDTPQSMDGLDLGSRGTLRVSKGHMINLVAAVTGIPP